MSSGNGTVFPYADLYGVQNELRQNYEAIIYDRPGYGFSDKPDSDRGIENIIDEVSAIIDDSTNNDELILVAHSMASLEILNFANHNSDRVKGIILIDGAPPNFAAEIESDTPLAIKLTRFAKNVGVLRLLSNIDDMKNNLMPPTNYPEKYDQMFLDFILSETWNNTMIEEREMLNENG